MIAALAMCVLLIDHDEEFRMALASEIVTHGYDVAHARNLDRAVMVLERLWPRCLLLDRIWADKLYGQSYERRDGPDWPAADRGPLCLEPGVGQDLPAGGDQLNALYG